MFTVKTIEAVEGSGVIRRLDDLGRIVLPKAERMYLRAKEDTPCEILRAKDETGRPYLLVQVYDNWRDDLDWRRAMERILRGLQTTAEGEVVFTIRTKSGAELGHSFLNEPEVYESISKKMEELPKTNSEAKLDIKQEQLSAENDASFLAWIPVYAEGNGALLGAIFAYGEKKAIKKSYPGLKLAGSALSAW